MRRTSELELHQGARAVLRESLVLGRPDGPGVLQLDALGSLARALVDDLHRSGLEPTYDDAVWCLRPVSLRPV